MSQTYRNTFLLLLILLAATVGAAFVDLDRYLPGHGWNTAVAMTIALAKGLLIALYFMHIRRSTKLTWVFAAAGFLWLAILIVLTMADYRTRENPLSAGTTFGPRSETRR